MEKKIIVGAASALLLGLLAISIINFFKTSDAVVGAVIAQDVQKLAHIFETINQTCSIISFDYQKNPINFLNVKSFASSEVGPMNLAYPEKWEGPYVNDNLEVQGKEYMVVQTHKGYFIVPGEGVQLPNDKIIGTDIILNEDADIAAMMQDEQFLSYQGRPLAARILKQESSVDPALAGLSE